MKKWVLRFRQADGGSFETIASGSKSIETRAATAKYTKIQAGDVLVITCGKEKIEKPVKTVRHFPSIEALLKDIPLSQIMPTVSSLEEAKRVYYAYPGYEQKIKDFGLLAFEL